MQIFHLVEGNEIKQQKELELKENWMDELLRSNEEHVVAHREIDDREEEGQGALHAKPAAVGLVCHAGSGRHLQGKLDGRLRFRRRS